MELHHQVRPPTARGAHLQHVHEVGGAGESPHRPLFPEKPGAVLVVELRGHDLHGNRAIEGTLAAPEHDTEPAAADLSRVAEAGVSKFRSDGVYFVALGR